FKAPRINFAPVSAFVRPRGPEQKAKLPYGPEKKAKLSYGPEKKAKLPCGPKQKAKLPYGPEQKTELHCGPEQKPKMPYGPEQKAQLSCGPEQKPKLPYGQGRDFCQAGSYKLVLRSDKCLERFGDCVEKGLTTAFATANSIPRTACNNILAARLCSLNVQICDQKRKRQNLSPYENADKVLQSCIKYARSQNVPISWNVLKEKSLEFANERGESSFVASNGWLQRFNSRHNLSFKKLCGEAADFDSSSLKEWKDVVLRDVLERYASANVFNVDECGLFFFIRSCQTDLFVSKVKNV
ncbi:hypothetical protein AVEN_113572-1, partial [Araneus ventricosus]